MYAQVLFLSSKKLKVQLQRLTYLHPPAVKKICFSQLKVIPNYIAHYDDYVLQQRGEILWKLSRLARVQGSTATDIKLPPNSAS